jgi:hypothetical protein
MDISDTEFEQGRERWTLANMLKFWSACPLRRCRRARSCMGDPNICHATFWPVVPGHFKAWLRALNEAKGQGRSVGQAGRLADAAAAEFRKRQALVAALKAKRKPRSPRA